MHYCGLQFVLFKKQREVQAVSLQQIWEAYAWHKFWKEFGVDALPLIAERIWDTSMGESDLFI